MKVGVLFPSGFEDPGEFLADARAMEAAGVDSVWLEEANDGLDPLLALAAIAAITTDLRIGLIATRSARPDHGQQRRMETLQQLSRQRFVSLEPAPSLSELIAPSSFGGGQSGGSERWRRVDVPADRDDWSQILQAAEHEADGIIVPMSPRLLDILRHPHDAIDRSDLQLAQG